MVIMKRSALLRSALGVTLLCGSAASSVHAAEPLRVVAQDLNKARESGRLGAVLWTRRADVCTLQLVINWPPPLASKSKPMPLPRIQVWLLKPDGSTIPWLQMIPPNMKGAGFRQTTVELMYRYPLSASQDATAAAIMVDDQYYIEQLKLKE
jgi:hypothetical protein